MIVDAHCHIFDYGRGWSHRMAQEYLAHGLAQTPVWWDPGRTWTAEDQHVDVGRLIREMDEAGVDKAIVFGVVARPYECFTDPALVADAAAAHPDRLIPFFVPDPLGGREMRNEMRRALTDGPFRGVKILPVYNHLALNDARLYPFYAIAEELGVPCVVHTGFTRLPECRLEWQDPELLDDVGAAFPELKLWMAHGGGMKWQSAFLVLNKYPNMAADLSFSGKFPVRMRAESLAYAKQLNLLPRLMWGTDYPFWGHANDLAWWGQLPAAQRSLGIEPALTDEDLCGLLGDNAARLLGLT